LNARQITTSKGAIFNKSSMNTLLNNRKYLGIYIYGKREIIGGMPQIIDDDLFNKVAEKMKRNKKYPARSRAKSPYLLTEKLYCGHCKDMMTGHCTNKSSKSGIKVYNYYKCKNSGGSKPCKKKIVGKDIIEDKVVDECRKHLTSQNIRKIAKGVMALVKSFDDKAETQRLESLLKEAREAKENHMVTLRACKDDIVRDMVIEDLSRIGAV